MQSDITTRAVSPLLRGKMGGLDLKPASTYVSLRVKPDRRQFQREVPAGLERREGLKRLYATQPASQ
jgi:hypothetical protein